MENKRFEIVASTKEIITEPNKNAIRVELQYGKDGKPTEIVFAELYNKEGAWAYTRSQVRIDCTKENATYLISAVKSLYESSTKVEKKASPKASKALSSAIETMTAEEKAELVKLLLGTDKPKTETPKAPTKAETPKTSDELVLESFLINKRPVKKTSK